MTNRCRSAGNRWKETIGSDPYEWQFITQHCFPVLSLGFRDPCAVAILAASANPPNLTPIARWRYDRKISASGRSELSRLHYRWPLTCNLEKRYSLRSSFGMYNLERQLWYWHLLTRHCPCNLLPEPTSPKHEYREKLWGRHPVTSSMTSSPYFFCIIWDDLFILKLCLIFQNFQNGRHFEPATNFYTRSFTGRRIY